MTPAEHPILMAGPQVRAAMGGRMTVTRRLVKALGNLRHRGRLLGDWGLSEDPEPYTGVERLWRPTHTPRPGDWLWTVQSDVDDTLCEVLRCPFGAVGDTLWVRENWRPEPAVGVPGGWALRTGPGGLEDDASDVAVRYQSDGALCFVGEPPGEWEWPQALTPYRWGRETRWLPSIHMPRWAARLFLRVESVTVERVQGITEDDARAEGIDEHPACEQALIFGIAYREAFRMVWDSLAPAGAKWADNPWVWRVGFTRIEVNS